jgi:hypothetical protein
MAHFAYVHQKLMRIIVMDSDGNKELDTPIPESTSIRSMSVDILRNHGYLMAGRWNEISDYSYAEVRKDAYRKSS